MYTNDATERDGAEAEAVEAEAEAEAAEAVARSVSSGGGVNEQHHTHYRSLANQDHRQPQGNTAKVRERQGGHLRSFEGFMHTVFSLLSDQSKPQTEERTGSRKDFILE